MQKRRLRGQSRLLARQFFRPAFQGKRPDDCSRCAQPAPRDCVRDEVTVPVVRTGTGVGNAMSLAGRFDHSRGGISAVGPSSDWPGRERSGDRMSARVRPALTATIAPRHRAERSRRTALPTLIRVGRRHMPQTVGGPMTPNAGTGRKRTPRLMPNRDAQSPDGRRGHGRRKTKPRQERGFRVKLLTGLEPSTFCMAIVGPAVDLRWNHGKAYIYGLSWRSKSALSGSAGLDCAP